MRSTVHVQLQDLLFSHALSFKMKEQASIFEAETIVIVMAVLFTIVSIGLYIFLWIRSRQKIVLILSGIVFILSALVLFTSGPSISWIIYSLIFNILLFIFSATLIYYSTKINSKMLLNFAIVGFVIHVVTRYFDLFWDLLSGSMLFIITGILGILGGWILERNRRRLIDEMNSGSER